MKKHEMLDHMETLLKSKGMSRIDGGNGKIGINDTKASIQNAIDCLETSDEQMRDYLTIIKVKYPNTYRTITSGGDWLTHYHNRLYVYNTARLAIA